MNDEIRSSKFIQEEIRMVVDKISSKMQKVKKENEDPRSENREILGLVAHKFEISMASISQEERRLELERSRLIAQRKGDDKPEETKVSFARSEITKAISKRKNIACLNPQKLRSRITLNPKAFHRKVNKIMNKILKWQTNRYNLIVKKFHLPKVD